MGLRCRARCVCRKEGSSIEFLQSTCGPAKELLRAERLSERNEIANVGDEVGRTCASAVAHVTHICGQIARRSRELVL